MLIPGDTGDFIWLDHYRTGHTFVVMVRHLELDKQFIFDALLSWALNPNIDFTMEDSNAVVEQFL